MTAKFELYQACWNGNAEDALRIVTANPLLLNQKLGGEFDDAALIIATRCGYESLCSQLLQLPGIEVNIEDKFGQTPLMIAAAYGHDRILNLLLKHDLVDINKENEGETALHYASFNGQSKAVQALVSHDQINLHKTDKSGKTAMEKCCQGDTFEESRKQTIRDLFQEAAMRPVSRSNPTSPPRPTTATTAAVTEEATSGTSPSRSPVSTSPIPPMVPPPPSQQEYLYDVFLTHDWGTDERNRSNHERVSRLNAALKRRGFNTWFDEERMKGNIRQLMAKAIATSKLVLVHVTQRYCEKIEKGDLHDSCYYEFNYAITAHPKEVEVVVMEERMKDVSQWRTRLRAEIGTLLYVEMWEDDPLVFERQVDILAKRITDKISTTGTNNTFPTPPIPPPPATTAATAATTSNETSYVEAWSLIDETVLHQTSTDPVALKALIEELGVSEAKDLEILLTNELVQIGELLKTIPQRKFHTALHRTLSHNPSDSPGVKTATGREGLALTTAWDLITPENLITHVIPTSERDLSTSLTSLGLLDASDLLWLSNEELLQIASCLKAVPSRRFGNCLKLEGEEGEGMREGGNAGEAWEFINPRLMTENRSRHTSDPSAGELLATLTSLGVTESQDLLWLKETELHQIAGYLKTVPQRKFLTALNITSAKI